MRQLSYKEIQALFIKAKQGDGQAFRKLYEATFRSQYFIAYNYVNDRYIAEEAVQNMYISFYNHLNTITNSMAIIKWMNTTIINECKKLIKTEKLDKKVDIDNYEDKLIDTNPTPEESYRQKEDKSDLHKALDKMEPELKEILIFRYVDKLKVKDIAKLSNLSTATVNRYIKTGTMKLKTYLKNISNNIYSVILSPFVFKIFKNTMDAQISDQHITDIFQKSFKTISVGAAGAATGLTAAKVASKAARKSTSTAAKIVGSGAATVTATAAVAVAAINPSFQVYMINNDGYLLNQRLLVSSNNYEQINSITCYKDGSIVGDFNSDNEYTIDIYDNGTYTIAVEDVAGIVHRKEVTITNVDYSCPNIDIAKNDNTYTATIADTGSGVNYDSLQIVNGSNDAVDYVISDNMVIFSAENPVTVISIADNLGNTKRLVLNNNQ